MKAIVAAAVFGAIMMFAGLFLKNKRHAVNLGIILILALSGIAFVDWQCVTDAPAVFNNMLTFNQGNHGFALIITLGTLLYLLLFRNEFEKIGNSVADYIALIFLILVGAYCLTAFNHLLLLFLGIEILSIPQYVLAGSDKRNLKSSEASLKYFITGAFTTGILLMGITLLYGASGTFFITAPEFLHAASNNWMGMTGAILIMIALSYKVSAAPFHQWTPDVYDGAPTAFTAFMSTVLKSAAIIAFVKLFQGSIGQLNRDWTMTLALIATATLFVGNVTAVYQQSVKRMLAYSSIAQAGFMLLPIIAASTTSYHSIALYATAYCLASLGLFSVLIKLKDFTYDGFNGLAKQQPLMAFCAAIFTLSLLGIPLTAGFLGKYFALRELVQTNYTWLVIFALVMAAMSSYYYLKVVIAMYFKNGEAELESQPQIFDKLLWFVIAGLISLLGFCPQMILNLF
jgi:NADH-quinone oxidoreductase subunit N